MPNNEHLDDTLQHIEDHPEEWDQTTWVCKTGGCFAGNALFLKGANRFYFDDQLDMNFVLWHGVAVDVENKACEILDLDNEQGELLFAPDNSMGDLRRIVKHLKGEWQPLTVTQDYYGDDGCGTLVKYGGFNSAKYVVVYWSQEAYDAAVSNGAEPVLKEEA